MRPPNSKTVLIKLPVDNGEKLVRQENKITGCATSATSYFLSRTALLLMCSDRKRTSAELETCCCLIEYYVPYGSTGRGVFKRGVQNLKDFCLTINILK